MEQEKIPCIKDLQKSLQELKRIVEEGNIYIPKTTFEVPEDIVDAVLKSVFRWAWKQIQNSQEK